MSFASLLCEPLSQMDVIERNKSIGDALLGRNNREIREKLHKLIIERQTRFLPRKYDLEVRKPISSGTFGIVDLVRYQKKLYAHKRPLCNVVNVQKSILDEAIKLTEITQHHPNIQRLYFINLESLGFLMDYCDCGPLDAFITSPTSIYTLVDALNWSYQLADALSFLHSINIMHRDVKTQNILLKDNYQKLVLTDYGTATNLGRDCLTNSVGTPVTMAPEVIRGTTYAEQCDIYSWSIVLWQLIAKNLHPYDTQNMTKYVLVMKVSTEKLRPPELTHCPKILMALMYRSWHSDANERPTLSFIKTVLGLLLKILPKNQQICSTEVLDEVKRQCNNDSNTLEKYFPCQPRSNNERSKNIYDEHSNKLKTISAIKQDILELDDKVQILSKQNQAKHDRHEQLLDENRQLEEQINQLRAAQAQSNRTGILFLN